MRRPSPAMARGKGLHSPNSSCKTPVPAVLRLALTLGSPTPRSVMLSPRRTRRAVLTAASCSVAWRTSPSCCRPTSRSHLRQRRLHVLGQIVLVPDTHRAFTTQRSDLHPVGASLSCHRLAEHSGSGYYSSLVVGTMRDGIGPMSASPLLRPRPTPVPKPVMPPEETADPR